MFRRLTHKSIVIFYDEARLPSRESDVSFIAGFRGFGLVGYITTLHLVETLDCSKIGHIVTKYMPDMIMYTPKGISSPYELYSCKVRDKLYFIVLVAQGIPDYRELTYFSEALVKFMKNISVAEAILVGGLDSRYKQGIETYRWLPNKWCNRKLDAPIIEEGLYIVGPLAVLTLFTELYGIPSLVVLPYTESSRPDPRAAAVAVEVINRIYDISVPVERLYREAERIEKMIKAIEEKERSSTSTTRVYM